MNKKIISIFLEILFPVSINALNENPLYIQIYYIPLSVYTAIPVSKTDFESEAWYTINLPFYHPLHLDLAQSLNGIYATDNIENPRIKVIFRYNHGIRVWWFNQEDYKTEKRIIINKILTTLTEQWKNEIQNLERIQLRQ